MKPQEVKPQAQTDWQGFCKGGAQCLRSGRLCAWIVKKALINTVTQICKGKTEMCFGQKKFVYGAGFFMGFGE